MQCPQGQTIDELMHFGLAFKNYTVTGIGLNLKVKTIDRCTLGKMANVTNEFLLEQQFKKDCFGKQRCTMYMDFKNIFSPKCQ